MGNQQGFSLIGVMVASSIMMIVMGGMAKMFVIQTQQRQGLEQKLTSMSMEQAIARVMLDSDSCSCQFQSFNINTSNPASHNINLKSLRSGCGLSSPNNILVQEGQNLQMGSPFLRVASVKVRNIRPTGTAHQYSGVLTVAYNNQGLVRAIRPIQVPLVLTIDPRVGTPSARPIKSCFGGTEEKLAESCRAMGGIWNRNTTTTPVPPPPSTHRVKKPVWWTGNSSHWKLLLRTYHRPKSS